MDIDSFLVHIKTDDIYKDIVEDGEARFDTQTLNQTDGCLKEKIKK